MEIAAQDTEISGNDRRIRHRNQKKKKKKKK